MCVWVKCVCVGDMCVHMYMCMGESRYRGAVWCFYCRPETVWRLFRRFFAPTDECECRQPTKKAVTLSQVGNLGRIATQDLRFLFLTPLAPTLPPQEVRPFLNAHFMSCRALSKVIPAPDLPAAQVRWI